LTSNLYQFAFAQGLFTQMFCDFMPIERRAKGSTATLKDQNGQHFTLRVSKNKHM